jgi:hypothetical protein
MRIVGRKIAVLIGAMAMTSLVCAQSDTITVQRHSRGGKNPAGGLALLYGELDGRAVLLQCVLSHADCKELPAGEYNIERLLEGEGSYKGCPNVDLYRLGADSFKEEPLGEYCLRERK